MEYLKAWLHRRPLLFWAYRSLRSAASGIAPDRSELKNATYDHQTLRVMKRVLAVDSICIDCGAHQGFFLDWMCRLAPAARHHAIEPLPHLHVALARKFPNQHIHPCALGETAGTAIFHHVVNAPAYSGLQERPYDGIAADIAEINVEIARLDDIIPADTVIALIKLDLEGGEYHALRGGLTLLRRSRPVLVFECGAGSNAAYGLGQEMIYNLLTEELGYAISTMSRWLNHKRGFTPEQFGEACLTEFFFIAWPAVPHPSHSNA